LSLELFKARAVSRDGLNKDATVGGLTKPGMGEGRARERAEREQAQVELAARYFKAGGLEGPGLSHLSRSQRSLLYQELKSHHSLHVAQGNEREAQGLLGDLEQLAAPLDALRYDIARTRISELERRGLGGRALELMGQLYQREGRSRRQPGRAAEIVMEYGILHDRHGDKEEALRLFKSSVGRYERSGQAYNLSAAWFNSASVLYDLGRTRAALNSCQKGLEAGGDGYLDLRTHLLLQRANCRERTREFELACLDYLEAAAGYGQLGNRRQQTNILFRVGWLMGRQDRPRESQSMLQQALVLAKELDYAAGLARFHLHRAQSMLEAHLPEVATQHVQQCLPHARLARLDRIDKLARGLLYRMAGPTRRPLTFYLKAKAPEHNLRTLEKAARGTYAHRGGDGAATRTWRDAPRPAGQDVTFLVRLLAELGRRSCRPDLTAQSNAVADWQRSVRQGRRIL
jgi:tetratricopeptide (TPR) repeat protein